METEGLDITPFQRQILCAIPAGNPHAKKPVRELPFFYIQKILKISTPVSIRNLASSIDCLAHKGLVIRKPDGKVWLTDAGLACKTGSQ